MLNQFEQFAEQYVKENERQCVQIDHLTQCFEQIKTTVDEIVAMSEIKGVKL